METNTTVKIFANTTKPVCDFGNQIYAYLTDNARLYLSLGAVVQCALTVIINILVLVVIVQTNQHRKSSSKTTTMLSMHDIIVTVISKSMLLFFTNYQMQDCKISTLLLSYNFNLSTFIQHIFASFKSWANMLCQFGYIFIRKTLQQLSKPV